MMSRHIKEQDKKYGVEIVMENLWYNHNLDDCLQCIFFIVLLMNSKNYSQEKRYITEKSYNYN